MCSAAQLLSWALPFVTLWTVACQAPLSMEFCRQEYWSRLPFSPPGDLPDPGIELKSPVSSGGFFTTEPPGKPASQKQGNDFISSLRTEEFSEFRRTTAKNRKL